MDELKKQAEELGIEVDGRWGEERLRAEIDKALDAPADNADALAEAAAKAAAEAEALAIAEAEALAMAEAEKAKAEEEARLAAELEAKAKEEADALAAQEEMARASRYERRAPTIKNLRENPNRRLGLKGFGSVQLTEAQMGDESLLKRIKHGIDTGVLSAE